MRKHQQMQHSVKTCAALLLFTVSLSAQNEPFFPKPSYFRRHFANTPTRVELQPPARAPFQLLLQRLAAGEAEDPGRLGGDCARSRCWHAQAGGHTAAGEDVEAG